MVNVFVSYAHEDIRRVEPLVSMLEAGGCTVWWDRRLKPGSDFEHQIEKWLTDASQVIIALTRHVASSDWVRAEAAVGRESGKLIPVLLDDVDVPLSLRALHVSDLRKWPDGGESEAKSLLSTVASPTAGLEQPFVGRHDAMRLLQQTFEATSKGNGGIVLMAGEPGIGKTRCAEEFAQEMEDQGTLVLWGRCYEHPGAPAYWPWVQILRELAAASSDDELRVLIGANGPEIAALVPEVGERLKQPAASEQKEERFRVFDAISRLFFKASSNLPLILILDDVHWADASSLSLLEFMARDVHRNAVLILCAYRDVEVTRKSQLLGTLGELTRTRGGQRLRLAGLNMDETGALGSAISGMNLPDNVVKTIFEQTDGNPLFVNEIARVLADEGRSMSGDMVAVDVPDGVREAIGRRLDRLSPRCNELLAVAAVVGRVFDVRIVATAQAVELEECVRELDAAVEGHIVQRTDEKPTAYRFTHAVVRETLYEELATVQRLKLHQLVAESLEGFHGKRLDPVLSEIAHHYFESAVLGNHDTAVEYALKAAARDEQMYAFEEAARHCEQALTVLIDGGQEEDQRTLHAYWRHGQLLRNVRGWVDRAMESLTRGLDLARRLGEAEMFAGFATDLVEATSYGSQEYGVPLLRATREHSRGFDRRDRQRVGSRGDHRQGTRMRVNALMPIAGLRGLLSERHESVPVMVLLHRGQVSPVFVTSQWFDIVQVSPPSKLYSMVTSTGDQGLPLKPRPTGRLRGDISGVAAGRDGGTG